MLLLGGASLTVASTPDFTINTFDTGTQGVQPNGSGFWYGTGGAGWDASQDNTGNGGGSLYIQTRWGGGDTPLTQYICNGYNNLWYQGSGTRNLSDYRSVQFDIKWDNSSAVSIAQWNNPSTFPLGSLGGSIPGLEVDAASGNNGGVVTLFTTNIPAAAASGWVHITIPVNPQQSGIDPNVGIMFKKWLNGSGSLAGLTNTSGAYTNTANFWIDNVILEGTAGPPPPPTIKPLVKAVQGLNVFASTKGNSFYDRQEVMSRQTSGLSWLGQATGGNPVSYSFTIASFPSDPASYGCEAYLFLSPNPGWNPSAPDWNDTNCTIAFVQMGAEGAIMRFQYKVNESDQNQMFGGGTEARGSYTNVPGSWDGVTPNYLESGNLGSVTNPVTAVGTWTITFTSDTNVTLTAPGGNVSHCVIPNYNVSKLGPTANGFNVYLGMQANNEAAINQAVVYSNFAVTGTVSPYSEDFLADTVLDTTTIWDIGVSGGPNGVLIVPAGSAYWLQWTLPDAGFQSELAGGLTGPWSSLSTGAVVPLSGARQRLVASSSLPVGDSAFFRLAKRVFTKLQILLPGETAAPNTLTGKTGTPTAQTVGVPFDVVVNAVDDAWNLIPTAPTDQISLSSTDPLFSWDPGFAVFLLNGTITFDTGTLPVTFGTAATINTITATDTTDGTKTANTSPAVTVNP